ncbi:MAG: DNA repair protein RecN [Myxococcales bacterium]|nr:DNA repair protein RecN [Myxococcales bacterium]
MARAAVLWLPLRSAHVLTYLRVRNFAIIDELEVELDAGMNVVTGETGAGKSILIEALSLVLGARARPEVVRGGAEHAEVEALFDIADDEAARARIEAAGVGAGDELVLRRLIQRSGRSRAYINGKLASASQLGELAAGLADISSQHQHHTLVDAKNHLDFLDAFATLQTQRAAVAAEYRRFADARRQLDDFRREAGERVEREDLLRYQIQEIEALNPEPGEHETLRAERDRQRHAERLAKVTASAEDRLYASDEALCQVLSRIGQELSHAAELDAELSPLAEQVAAAEAQLEDVARELGAYARRVSLDEERLAEVEDRLDGLSRLMRKYGGSLEAVLAHRERAEQELAALEHSEQRREELEATARAAEAEVAAVARKLSKARARAARKLGQAISEELRSLSMGEAEITVDVAQPQGGEGELCVDGARLSPTGIDRVELLIATNRGEAPQPLQRIASGGELSRAMLAVKRVLAGLGPAGLYVFDEVDAGVGGAVAEVIGRKIKDVAQHHQVLCITHLPQIAVFSDAHYHVSKRVEDGRTHSHIARLSTAEQREEIARMLGGIEISEKTRAAAREMLKTARR